MDFEKNQQPGVVYWITGMSAAGKTTIARELVSLLKVSEPAVVFLDGDAIREAFGNDLGHTEADRRKSAMRNSQLCKLLADQGLTVVIATISLFHDCQKWNRKNIAEYREVFVSVPLEIRQKRDPKKIYQGAGKKAKAHIVGLDIKAELPKKPDITVVNDGSKTPREVAKQVLNHFLAGTKYAA